jgi:hypothetical protein
VNRLQNMDGPADSARIDLLDEDERQITPNGPAVVDTEGVRHDLPPLVFEAVQHVIEAMQAGMAVKVIPLRPELPIDDAADAIEIRSDILRKYAANGTIPFQSTEYVDWVRLADVIAFDRERSRMRSEGVQKLLDEERWDESPTDERPE